MTNHKHQETCPTDIHKHINWVVSVLLIAFAIWSIMLNAQGRSMFKQANQFFVDIDHKIEELKDLAGRARDACLQSQTSIDDIVIPETTTGNHD